MVWILSPGNTWDCWMQLSTVVGWPSGGWGPISSLACWPPAPWGKESERRAFSGCLLWQARSNINLRQNQKNANQNYTWLWGEWVYMLSCSITHLRQVWLFWGIQTQLFCAYWMSFLREVISVCMRGHNTVIMIFWYKSSCAVTSLF